VSVALERFPPYEETLVVSCAPHPRGGLLWCYWDFDFRTSEGLSLKACLRKHGSRVWKDERRDIRARVIFTDDTKSYRPGHCFIVGVDRPRAGGQVGVRGQELNSNVVRISRSEVPVELGKLISFWEIVNLRESKTERFWDLSSAVCVDR
jgi:hypothetical protein